MKEVRKRGVLTLVAGCVLSLGAAQAQFAGLTRTSLGHHELSIPGREVIQVRVDFPPGSAAARHRHPGEELVYVIEGSLVYELDGRPPAAVKAGEVLFIPKGIPHAVRNEGKTAAAELATYIVEKGKPLAMREK